jgi:hypothetical protein
VTRQMSMRDRRALTWGACILGPVLLFQFVVRPYVAAVRDGEQRLIDARQLLTREMAALADTARFAAIVSSAEQSILRAAPRLFEGPDDVTATSALAYYVSDEARRARVALKQVEPRATEEIAGGLLSLMTTVRAEGDLEGILDLLRALERGPKLVRVEALSIEGAARVPVAIGGDGAETLSVTLIVRGYSLNRNPSAKRPAVGRRSGA